MSVNENRKNYLTNNLKQGDRFKADDFCGWIYVSYIGDDKLFLRKEHVSGTNYSETIDFNDFHFNLICGKYNTFIRI